MRAFASPESASMIVNTCDVSSGSFASVRTAASARGKS
jgi:hypothetical protein